MLWCGRRPPHCDVPSPRPGALKPASLPCLPVVVQLHALRRLYGSNVCGEGGEYESLTLDCPALFTHGRIVLDSWRAVVVSQDSLAPVALLHPTSFHVEPRQPPSSSGAAGRAAAGVVEVAAGWAPDTAPRSAAAAAEADGAAGVEAGAALEVQLSVTAGAQYCSVTASVAPPAGATAAATAVGLASAAGTAAALSAALRCLSDALPGMDLDWAASLFIHLYVPSMAQFGAANAAYAAVLPEINPPSRATVELARGCQLALVVEALFARWVVR